MFGSVVHVLFIDIVLTCVENRYSLRDITTTVCKAILDLAIHVHILTMMLKAEIDIYSVYSVYQNASKTFSPYLAVVESKYTTNAL